MQHLGWRKIVRVLFCCVGFSFVVVVCLFDSMCNV